MNDKPFNYPLYVRYPEITWMIRALLRAKSATVRDAYIRAINRKTLAQS